MYTSTLLAVFVGVAYALPQRRAEGLTVKVTGPTGSVSSVDDFKLVAAVTNEGAEDVKVLKYGTVLDSLPTRSFVVSKDGKQVPFSGVKVSVELNEDAFTTIPAGQTVKVEHKLAALYDFSSFGGAGTFTFTPAATLRVAGASEKISVDTAASLAKVSVHSATVNVQVSEGFGVEKRELPINKRAVSVCSNASRKSFIDASYSESKALARDSSSYITSRGASDTLYRAYWGALATSRVTSVFNAVANENSGSRTLSCTDTYGVCNGGVIAYTVTSTTNIYYCSIFFNEVPSTSLCSGTSVNSRNVRGGTTLHEVTHAVAGTDDVTYGCAADQALSDSQAVINADNYNCFATQVYANTRC